PLKSWSCCHGGLVDAGAGFGVEALELHVELGKLVDHLEHELRISRSPQHAVAEHSGRQGAKVPVILLAQALRRLAEKEKFIFSGEIRSVAERGRALYDLPKHLARGDRDRRAFLIDEVEQK